MYLPNAVPTVISKKVKARKTITTVLNLGPETVKISNVYNCVILT